jgi:hypothetical protein
MIMMNIAALLIMMKITQIVGKRILLIMENK